MLISLVIHGASPLFVATEIRSLKIVEMLLERGANPNLARSDGCTPLYMATQEGKKEIVKMLLDAGVDPNIACTDNECTPIMVAIFLEDIEITKLLIEKVDLDKNIFKGNSVEKLIEELMDRFQ